MTSRLKGAAEAGTFYRQWKNARHSSISHEFPGDIRMRWSNTIYVDPAFVVVDGGDGGYFGTGGVREIGSDVTRTPQPIAPEPDRLLPPPQP